MAKNGKHYVGLGPRQVPTIRTDFNLSGSVDDNVGIVLEKAEVNVGDRNQWRVDVR